MGLGKRRWACLRLFWFANDRSYLNQPLQKTHPSRAEQSPGSERLRGLDPDAILHVEWPATPSTSWCLGSRICQAGL